MPTFKEIFQFCVVQRNPPYFYQPPSPVTAVKSSKARFDCITLGDPPPTIQWLRNDMVLTYDTTKYSILENGSLVVQNVKLDDEGYFKCDGSNIHGSIQSIAVQLTVACKYYFI